MSVLSWLLYAGVRVRIVPGSVKNGVSGRGASVKGGGWLSHILRSASCRRSGRSVEARGAPQAHGSRGISSTARTGPGARSPHQEGPGSPGLPGAPGRPGTSEARAESEEHHSGRVFPARVGSDDARGQFGQRLDVAVLFVLVLNLPQVN